MTEQESNLKEKTVKGMFWGGIDMFFTKGLNFVFNLLIARQLSPDDYGMVAIVAVIMAVCQCFVDSGFGAALVRKGKCTEDDFSSIFYFNIAVALVLYILLFIGSPIISEFYKQPLLKSVTKIYSIILIINALAIVQNSKLTIEVNFKAFARISIISSLVSGSVALYFALRGYGIWSLIIQSLANAAIRTIMLWVISYWRPKAIFSLKSINECFSFGSKLLGSSIINTLYNNIYTLVIGKVYSPESLGTYTRGESIIKFPSETATTVISNVSYPILSSIKEDKEHYTEAYRQLTRMASFIIFPMVIGLAAIADPFIRICLTDKWEMSIPIMQILSFSLLWAPVTSIDLTILKVIGRSDYFLKITIITKIINIAILVSTVPFGLIAMCYGQILATLIHLIVDAYYTKISFGYGLKEKISDCGANFLIAMVMGAIVILAQSAMPSPLSKLCVGVPCGVLSYIILSKIFKIKELNKYVEIIVKTIKWSH